MAKSSSQSGIRNYPENFNPFLDDDEDKDVDDFTFINNPRHGSSGYMLGGPQNSEYTQRQQELLDERKRIEERTLQSSINALRTLDETEQIGVATGQEMIRQGETLKKIEYRLDDVNSSLRTSQKHITSMKSIFGGIKSYFSRNNPEPSVRVAGTTGDETERPSKLQQVVNTNQDSTASSQNSYDHPALRLKGIDTTGFASVMDDDYKPNTSHDDSYSSFSRQVDQQLDNNLDDISKGLGRLKNLGLALHDEISEQNETLGRLTGKMERTEDTLAHQNREISRILKK